MTVAYAAMEGFYGNYLPWHLQALQTVCEGYYVSKGKERVRRALRMSTHKVDHDFLLGDTLEYYTKPEAKHRPGWQGPAVVVAVEKYLLLVRHIAGYFRRHSHHVRLHIPGPGSEDNKLTSDKRATHSNVQCTAIAAPEKNKDEDKVDKMEDNSGHVKPGTELQGKNETNKASQGSEQEPQDQGNVLWVAGLPLDESVLLMDS